MKHLVLYLYPFEGHLTLDFKSMRTEWNTIIGKGDKLIKSQQQTLHYGSMNENVTLSSVAQALFFVGSDMSMVPAEICWKKTQYYRQFFPISSQRTVAIRKHPKNLCKRCNCVHCVLWWFVLQWRWMILYYIIVNDSVILYYLNLDHNRSAPGRFYLSF